jgi:hypothetical protein
LKNYELFVLNEINVTTRFRDDIQEETTTPQKGDFVFCINSSGDKKIDEFLNNNIGQIGIIDNNEKTYKYVVRYKDVPIDIQYYFNTKTVETDGFCRLQMSRREITFFGPDRSELRLKLKMSKYNL